MDAILIPGGFGKRGTDGKIEAIKYARNNKIPFLGICYGMQMAIIEFARNKLNLKKATSSEIDKKGLHIIGLLNEWIQWLEETKTKIMMMKDIDPDEIKEKE